jgi:hypothetical protein
MTRPQPQRFRLMSPPIRIVALAALLTLLCGAATVPTQGQATVRTDPADVPQPPIGVPVKATLGTLPPGVNVDASVNPHVQAPQGQPPNHGALGNPGYAAAKAEAALHVAPRARPPRPQASRTTLRVQTTPVSPTVFESHPAANENLAGGRPADPSIAVGNDYYAETTNKRFDVYRRTDQSLVEDKSLADLFNGYTAATLFDPRILHDQWSGRWFIIADAFSETSGPQNLQIAVSNTPSILSGRCVRKLDVGGLHHTDFLDYPMIGVTSDAVIITGNMYDRATGARLGTKVIDFQKSSLLNTNCSAPLVYGHFLLDWNLTPPIVYDQNPQVFLIGAPFLEDSSSTSSALPLYVGTNFGQPSSATLTLRANVPVPTYKLPAPAPECGTPYTINAIDTLDTRFVNSSSQWASSLWNVHTTSDQPTNQLATPRWYQIDTTAGAVTQTGQFFVDGTSSDWNASTAVNSLGEALFTWSSHDETKTPCVHPQIALTGRKASDTPGLVAVPPVTLVTSPSEYYYKPTDMDETTYRWGDFSTTVLDPSPDTQCPTTLRNAWIVNEYNLGPQGTPIKTPWATQVGRIGYC